MSIPHILDDSSVLSPRAQRFVREKGRRENVPTGEQLRDHWRRHGRTGPLVDKMVDYHARWGGLALPELAIPLYDGGLAVMYGDDPDDIEGVGPCFSAGTDHYSVAHWLCVDLQGCFGVLYEDWVPLHSSVTGWIEASALADVAQTMHQIRVWRGDEARQMQNLLQAIPGLTSVLEVEGLADNWWESDGTLLATYEGEAKLFPTGKEFTALYTESQHRAEELRARLLGLGL
ncbi:hypothetical protein ACOZ38_44385 [Sphaerisporangium viridialbum]|uniref:hypothetical protein n=1 Tax=Sphaerisporangium viridialbum TaxID=46189 RepID=UPI003C70EB0F